MIEVLIKMTFYDGNKMYSQKEKTNLIFVS